MRLARSFREMVSARAARDPAFASALVKEAEMLSHEDDARAARRILNIGRRLGHAWGTRAPNRTAAANTLKLIAKCRNALKHAETLS